MPSSTPSTHIPTGTDESAARSSTPY
jgi:hypothetical protein